MPLQMIRNDITKVKADIIVNTANTEPCFFAGTDSAIYKAAGKEALLEKRRELGHIDPGNIGVTPAFALHARYIIHAVSSPWKDGNHGEELILRNCYRKSLEKALELDCKSIAFPLLSSGNNGLPKGRALQIALSEISDFLLMHNLHVYLVVFDKEAFILSEQLFDKVTSFIDERYVDEVGLSMNESEYKPRLREVPAPGWLPADKPKASESIFHHKVEETTFKQGALEKEPDFDFDTHLGETFQQRLLRLVDEHQMTDVEVYKKANIDRKLFSKIRCNVDYKPTKKTAVALAVALELDLDEMKDLLSRAELALSPSSRFDLIVEYFVLHGIYDIHTINSVLFKYDQQTLGV
ncbi:MAG: macro domain-containing protein [Filifactor alocis]|nr:macro domain-containing protein [Filifactor alocis]